MRFTDMQPWDQKVSKVPKETFPRLRINIRAVYRTWRILESLEIISIFGKVVSLHPLGKSDIWTARGKLFLFFVQDTSKLVFEFLSVLYLSNSQNSVLMKFAS